MRTTAEVNPRFIKMLPFPTNVFSYTPTKNQTMDQMVKGSKYLSLVSHDVCTHNILIIEKTHLTLVWIRGWSFNFASRNDIDVKSEKL